MKTDHYAITPIQLGLKGIATIADTDTIENFKSIRVRSVSTLPTSTNDAKSRSQDLLKHVRQRIRQGNHQALVNLLDEHPEFSAHPWVSSELLKWQRTGRSLRKRGRRKGSFSFHPLVIASVVEELKKRGWAKTNESAFEWLSNHWAIGYDTARDQYYQAWREERFKAVFIENPNGTKFRTAGDIEKSIKRAELLQTGDTLVRAIETPDGLLSITFRGL